MAQKNIDNSHKAISGAQSKDALGKLLDQKQEEGVILSVRNRKFGYCGKRQNQFKCDYHLTFADGAEWILFSANSLTTDRLKTKQWDAYNIKHINGNIEKAYIICPDKNNKQTVKRYRGYIRKDEDKSSIDDILFPNEFSKKIEEKVMSGSLNGERAAKNGFAFEKEVKMILENDKFLEKWKSNCADKEFSFLRFCKIMDKLGLKKDEVCWLSATTNIPELPKYKYKDGSEKKGGKPKTDVLLTVYQKKEFTFSCKNTTSDYVTVAEFPAKYCAEILEDEKLENLLAEYEKLGGPKNMEKGNKQKFDLLSERMKPHLDFFHRWVLRGTEKHCSKIIQLADYIVFCKKKEMKIETIDECIERVKKGKKKGNFGTIFQWTVTSRDEKGERHTRLKIPDKKKRRLGTSFENSSARI